MSDHGRDRLIHSRRVLAVWLVAASTLLAATACRACGLCDEDKVAATYDHAVVTTAASQHHRMMFAALVGPLPVGNAALAGRITRELELTTGVDTRTARVSLSPAAVSLAWDPGKTTQQGLLAALAKALAPHGLGLRRIEAVLPSSAVTLARATRR
jgi:hypothetical protein